MKNRWKFLNGLSEGDPLAEVLRYYHINVGEDGHEFEDSPDRKNWLRWTGKPSHGGEETQETASADKAA